MKAELENIFNDDAFGILEEKKITVKTDKDRLIQAFQEITTFFEKNQREPIRSMESISEFKLGSRLYHIRQDADKMEVLKPYDKHNLLNCGLE